MVKATSVSESQTELSTADRLSLIQALSALSPSQFDELISAFDVPANFFSDDSASLGNRSVRLLNWIESPLGNGFSSLEHVLGNIIAKYSKTVPGFTACIISGEMSSPMMPEPQAIIQRLRQEIGDNSIDIVFVRKDITEGGRHLILSGSAESLNRLQKLFASGALTPLIHALITKVHSVNSDTSDARKARLIQALRLREQPLIFARARALTSTLDLARIRARDLTSDFDCASTDASTLATDIAVASTLAIDLTLDLTSTCTNTLEHARNRAIDLAMDLASASAGVRAIALTTDRVRAIDIAIDIAIDLNFARARAIDIAYASTRASTIDLKHADLRGANLRDIDLRGADLRDADLIDADVAGTIFGDNLGLTVSEKKNLQQRGAVFQDAPGSEVPSLWFR